MRNRSVIELMVLGFAFIVGITILGLGVLIVIVELTNPEVDTGPLAYALVGLVNGILGALLGLVVSRSDAASDLHRRPGNDKDELK